MRKIFRSSFISLAAFTAALFVGMTFDFKPSNSVLLASLAAAAGLISAIDESRIFAAEFASGAGIFIAWYSSMNTHHYVKLEETAILAGIAAIILILIVLFRKPRDFKEVPFLALTGVLMGLTVGRNSLFYAAGGIILYAILWPLAKKESAQ